MVGIEQIWRFCYVLSLKLIIQRALFCVLFTISTILLLLWPHVQHGVSGSQKVQSRLFSVSCLKLSALALLVDRLFYLTSALIELLYSLNVTCSPIIIPRYLVWFLGIIFWPIRRKLRCLVIYKGNYFSFANV